MPLIASPLSSGEGTPETSVVQTRDVGLGALASNAEILMRAFAGWGKGKPPELGDGVRVDAELIVPNSLPYGGGVFHGRERIAQWFAEDLWEMWAEFSSTPTDLIDGGDKLVVPVHVKAKTHGGKVVEADNVWIYEFEDGALRRARVYVDTATIRDAVLGREDAG